MIPPTAVLRRVGAYLREHPEEIVRFARNAVDLRFGLPFDAFRFLAGELWNGERGPRDVRVEGASPGVRLGARLEAMGTPLSVDLVLTVEEIDVAPDALRVALRLSELHLEVTGPCETPLAALLRSGSLDLSKPGNLVAYMPRRPPALVDARDDRLVLDLLKVPKLAANTRLRRALSIVSPVMGVRSLRANGDHLDVELRADLGRVAEAIAAART